MGNQTMEKAMKRTLAKLLILALSLSPMVASEDVCAIKNETSFMDDVFCRRVLTLIMLERYDSLSIKTGFRISTTNDSRKFYDAAFEGAEQCYQTCMLKNMY